MKLFRNPFRPLLNSLPALLVVFYLLTALPANAAGLLKPLGGSPADAISIGDHRVDVVINNGFAQTTVDQNFRNSSDAPLSATYSFPLPKQASLSELSLWIAGQEILGEVVEKQQAKQIYQQQQAAGRQAALGNQDDFKSFDVEVANIPAGGEVRIRLVYYQPLEIDLNVGRYIYPLAEGNVDEQRVAFWSVDDRVGGAFEFNLQLKSSFPVKEVRLPGLQNEAQIQQIDGNSENGSGSDYQVSIARPAGSSLSRDIVFYYRLDDSVPARVELVPYRPSQQDDGTFMLVVTPAADLQPISEGTDWTFILDVSGRYGRPQNRHPRRRRQPGPRPAPRQ